jgi:hypothetical protein
MQEQLQGVVRNIKLNNKRSKMARKLCPVMDNINVIDLTPLSPSLSMNITKPALKHRDTHIDNLLHKLTT